MNPQELLRIARQLANGLSTSQPGSPSDDELRRAISTAYYALFHSLAASCADIMIGTPLIAGSTSSGNKPTEPRTWPRKGAVRGPHGRDISAGHTIIAAQFVDMQSQRHDADYKPSARFPRLRSCA